MPSESSTGGHNCARWRSVERHHGSPAGCFWDEGSRCLRMQHIAGTMALTGPDFALQSSQFNSSTPNRAQLQVRIAHRLDLQY
jgi:hypothetical protein